MKRNLFLLLTILSWDFISAQDWNWISPYPTCDDINGICFTNPTTGYFVGIKGTILKTTDIGITWENKNIATLDTFTSVNFPSSDTGYVVGRNGSAYKTTNGGTSWSQLVTGITKDLTSVFFFNGLTGYVAGRNGAIYKTTDGGTTWLDLTFGLNRNWNSICFTSAQNGFIGGNYGIYKTVDGGLTWSNINTSYVINAFTFIDSMTGFAVGGEGQNGIILKTTNGGNTWTNQVENSISSYFTAIHFPTPDTGYAVGSKGYVFNTTNGGIIWNSLNTGTNRRLTSIWFPTPSTGFFGGPGGLIWKTTDGGANWFFPGTFVPVPRILDVKFTDESHGFAAGASYGYSDTCTFLRTEDGGDTWTVQSTHKEGYVRRLSFPSSTVGYGVGEWVIFKTVDAGLTWNLLQSPANIDLTSVFFTDPDHGVAVGKQGKIIRTTDGGDTWTMTNYGDMAWFFDVFFLSPDIGYISGTGYVWKTINGGETWSPLNSPSPSDLYSIFFIDENTGFTAGGKIYKTTDGGWHWSSFDIGDDYITFMYFIDPSTAYAVSINGRVLYTNDGWSTWSQQLSPAIYPLWSVFFTNYGTGIAVGDNAILKTNNGGGVGLKENLSSGTIRLFPNPALDHVTVNLSAKSHSASRSLQLFDLTGRKVLEMTGCLDQVTISVQSLPAGIYVVRSDDRFGRLIKL